MSTYKFLIITCLIVVIASCNKDISATRTSKVSELSKVEQEKTSAIEKAEEEKMVDEVIFSRDGEGKVPKDVVIEEAKNSYLSGLKAHDAGDFGKAIELFSKCINQFPEYAEAWNGRAMSKYKSGNKDGACSDWQKASELGSAVAGNMVTNYCK